MELDNAYALLIGVGGDLPITVNDATSIATILTDKTKAAYKNENVITLTNTDATRENILNSLDIIISKTNGIKNTTVIIYYSGHGGIYKPIESNNMNDYDYFLLTYGFKTSSRNETGIRGDEFSEKINSIKSTKLLVMVDCCHAAGVIEDGPLMKHKGPDDAIIDSNIELIEKLQTGNGKVFLASCAYDQFSYIFRGAQNSLFTQVVLEALSGEASFGAKYVNMIDLLFYVLREVPRRHKNQKPVLKQAINLSADYYLCKNSLENQSNSLPKKDNYLTEVQKEFKQHSIDNSPKPINISKEINSNDATAVIDEIKNLIINDNTHKAIQKFLSLTKRFFPDSYHNAILLAGNYNMLLNQKYDGLITDANFDVNKTGIYRSLLYKIERL